MVMLCVVAQLSLLLLPGVEALRLRSNSNMLTSDNVTTLDSNDTSGAENHTDAPVGIVSSSDTESGSDAPVDIVSSSDTESGPDATVGVGFNSDNLTAFGSRYASGDENRPVTTVGIGFNYCGLDVIERVLSKHPGTIIGAEASTQYFLPKRGEVCSRFRSRKGKTPFQHFVNGCFKNKSAGAGQTYVDITGEYAPFAMDGVAERLRDIGNETDLRFIALVCDPRVRAMSSVKRHLRAENKRAGGKFLDEGVLHAMHLHEKQGFDGAIAVGEYGTMLEAWLHFFPPESMMVVNARGLKNIETWRRIFTHIGLAVPQDSIMESWVQDELVGDHALFKHAGVEVKRKLNEHFGEKDAQLFQLLQTEFW